MFLLVLIWVMIFFGRLTFQMCLYLPAKIYGQFLSTLLSAARDESNVVERAWTFVWIPNFHHGFLSNLLPALGHRSLLELLLGFLFQNTFGLLVLHLT